MSKEPFSLPCFIGCIVAFASGWVAVGVILLILFFLFADFRSFKVH